ncbi:hypothetical protein MFIFM68171_08556 [Madurella fahalii]|uniref:Major facilitator superfamily (MFS) profile domain-containing protein n=1 Tax=Madurella fahalii TaxID=1157608 RepID=A0ABQ0GKS0_9PEZI
MDRTSTELHERASAPRHLVAQQYARLVEAQAQSPDKIFITGSELKDLDPNLVTLDHNAGEHPRSWPLIKKVRTTGIVAALCFLSPFASTIFAPSIHLVMADLGITDSTLGALQVSVFLFAYAVGPLFLAPLSELYGRAVILQLGNIVFVAFSVGGGFSRTPAQLSVCRFLAGIGGSSGLAVVGGVAMDLWDLEARPKATGLIMLGPILGPILGPVCGGWMSAGTSWRWTMWVPAISAGFLGLLALIWLDESYAPWILQTKLRRARAKSHRADFYSVLDLNSVAKATLGSVLVQFIRPVIYLVVDPALLLASLFYSMCFGVAYLVLVTYADVFGFGYGHSVGIIGTDFLALGVGMIIGTVGTMKLMEAVFKKDSPKDKPFKPESRLLSCAPGLVLGAGGLLLYGFAAFKTHFIVPLIGIAIFAVGVMSIMPDMQIAIQVFTVESFEFPASAFASISVLRCLFAGAFPLFGQKLFVAVGVDWGIALLAFLILGIGLPFVPVMYKYGPRLRKVGAANMARLEGYSVENADK